MESAINLNSEIDMTNVIPIGVDFKLQNKKYTLIYNYRAITRLEQIYGSLSEAMQNFSNNLNAYDDTINFLWCALTDEYKLSKQDIEKWIGADITPWKNIVFDAIIKAYGHRDTEDSEGETEGE